VVSQVNWGDTVRPDGGRVAGIRTIALRLAAHWEFVLAAFGVMLLQSPLGAVRWRLLLRVQGIHITFLESLRLTYIGWFFNTWMPGATGGDFIKAYYIAKQTHHKPEAVTVVFLDRVIGLVSLAMLGTIAVLISAGDERLRVAQTIVVSFLALAVLGCGLFYSRRMRRLVRLDRLLLRLPLRHIVERTDRALFIYRHHKAAVARAVLYSWGAQAVSVLAIWWLATGLGSHAAWYHFLLNMPVVWIGWSLVPVPGGFGVAESLAQQLFSPAVLGGAAGPLPAAEAATLALAMILALRLVQGVVSLPGAVFYLARRTAVSPREMRVEMQSTDLAAESERRSPDASGDRWDSG
ncbi:MAG: flippase-like domain-containing protein, partial [Candidatus Brocadiae bacterium]|nr:flippase-like domain-containing protein [Candidatus Brocadiia bacterium]